MENRIELELWSRYFEASPPGDQLIHYLLARIGYTIEAALGGKSRPDIRTWFPWLTDDEAAEADGSTARIEAMQARAQQLVIEDRTNASG